jgi:translation initiation factor IF-3
MFKGREMAYTEKGEELLNRFVERTNELAKVETPAKLEGRSMNVILTPSKMKTKKN